MDADGATRFSDLALLEQAMDAIGSQHGIVVGSRAHLVNSEAVVKVRGYLYCPGRPALTALPPFPSARLSATCSCTDSMFSFERSASAALGILSVASR